MRWRCTWCGRECGSDDSPCQTCGREEFESAADGSPSPFQSDPIAWKCTNCGREHVKNTPQCSRCGNHDLKRHVVNDVDLTSEISVPSYLTVGKPYLVGIVAVVAVVALVAAGVVPLPGMSDPPSPPDAPGDGDGASGLDFAVVESAVHERFETERRSAGFSERRYDDGLAAFIEYATRHRVAERYDSSYVGTIPDFEAFGPRCESPASFGVTRLAVDIDEYDDETEFADALADALLLEESYRDAVLSEGNAEGIDVHVSPDGIVYVGYAAC